MDPRPEAAFETGLSNEVQGRCRIRSNATSHSSGHLLGHSRAGAGELCVALGVVTFVAGTALAEPPRPLLNTVFPPACRGRDRYREYCGCQPEWSASTPLQCPRRQLRAARADAGSDHRSGGNASGTL